MHFSIFKSCISVSLGSLLLGLTASAQTPDNPLQVTQTKLPLKADLVLSPEFCDTRQRQSIAFKDVLRVGEPACSQLEAELNKVFSLLRTVETIPAPGTSSAEVVLIPRFVDISATKPMLPSSQRELVILLEWTIQNTAGRTIWLQTVQGLSNRKLGWWVTAKAQNQLIEAAVGELAKASAMKMSTAPELRKLTP